MNNPESEKPSKKGLYILASFTLLFYILSVFIEPLCPMEPIPEEQISLEPLPLAPALIAVGGTILAIAILALMPWGAKA